MEGLHISEDWQPRYSCTFMIEKLAAVPSCCLCKCLHYWPYHELAWMASELPSKNCNQKRPSKCEYSAALISLLYPLFSFLFSHAQIQTSSLVYLRALSIYNSSDSVAADYVNLQSLQLQPCSYCWFDSLILI